MHIIIKNAGEILTDYYADRCSGDEWIEMAGLEPIVDPDKNPWDPDYTFEGKEIWYDDLELVVE